jgi:hypothetical protein
MCGLAALTYEGVAIIHTSHAGAVTMDIIGILS